MAKDDMSRPLPVAPVQMVAIDLDATMLRSDNTLSPATVQAVKLACAQGIRIVLATGRPPRMVRQYAKLLGLDSLQIAHNGAVIYDPKGHRLVRHQSLDIDVTRRILRTISQVAPQVTVGVEIVDKLFTDSNANVLTKTPAVGQHIVSGNLQAALTQPVTKILATGSTEDLAEIQAQLSQSFSDAIDFAISHLRLLQILHPQAHKAIALAHVADHYGIDRSSVMAIGDAPNDLTMINWAGLGIAVGNAWDEVQRAAHFVVASNDNDGVATALKRFALSE